MIERQFDAGSKITKDDSVVFYTVCGFFFLCLFRLLTIGYFRPDDLARTLTGYYDWSNDGRPLTTLIMRLLVFDTSSILSPNNLVDNAPLSQFLAIGLTGCCGVFIRRCFPTIQPLKSAIAAILLFATPFILEPMSYIFDSLGVVASMALGLFSVLMLVRKSGRAIDIAFSTAFLLASLMFYQTGLNVYIAFASGHVLFQLANHHPEARATAARLFIVAIVASCLYLFVILLLRWSGLIIFHEYQVAHSRIWKLSEAPEGVVTNFITMSRYVASVTGIRSLYALLMAATIVKLGWTAIYHTIGNPYRLLLTLLSLGCLGVGFAGPMLLLANPIYAPRVFCGVGGMIAAAWLYDALSARSNCSQYMSISIAVGLMICFIRYSFVYGAMAKDFDRYETFTCPTIAEQINTIADTTGVRSLAIFGSLPYPLSIRHSYEAFPGIRPIPINQTGIDAFTQALLLRYGLDSSLKLVEKNHHDTCSQHRRNLDRYFVWLEKKTIFLVFEGSC